MEWFCQVELYTAAAEKLLENEAMQEALLFLASDSIKHGHIHRDAPVVSLCSILVEPHRLLARTQLSTCPVVPHVYKGGGGGDAVPI